MGPHVSETFRMYVGLHLTFDASRFTPNGPATYNSASKQKRTQLFAHGISNTLANGNSRRT